MLGVLQVQCQIHQTIFENLPESKTVELVGNTHKTNILIESIETCALIDTGSQITTLAKWFFVEHFSDSPLEIFQESLQINLADGNLLEYIGVVCLKLSLPEIDPSLSFSTPVVIVSDTDFNKGCPLILGTNVIDECRDHLQNKFGNSYTQKSKISTPWCLAFQCLRVH
jgi:hypothetical protein